MKIKPQEKGSLKQKKHIFQSKYALFPKLNDSNLSLLSLLHSSLDNFLRILDGVEDDEALDLCRLLARPQALADVFVQLLFPFVSY